MVVIIFERGGGGRGQLGPYSYGSCALQFLSTKIICFVCYKTDS